MKKWLVTFALGASIYPLLEIGFRGYSHWSMGVAGGLALNMLVRIDNKLCKPSLVKRCLLGAVAITGLEFLVGCIVNLGFKLSVWDYSHLPGQIMGQICLPFTMIWSVLCLPVFMVLRHKRTNLR